jgi:hypothetical protein
MATWDVDLVLVLRVLIGDLNSPQKNSDAYLQRLLITAGIIAQNEIDLPFDYIFDIENITITPDPIEVDDILTQALLPLKAACILNQSQFQIALSQGIKVRDGDSAIDTSVGFRGYRDILQFGPCAAYAALLWQMQSANSSNIGGAVLSPYRGPNDSPIDTVSWFYDEFFSTINGSCSRYGRI